LDEYNEALTLNPQLADAHHKIGEIYFQLKAYHQAILSFRIALVFNSKSAEVYRRFGNVYFKLGRYRAALSHYKTALVYKPHFGKALADIADLYFIYGNHRKAIGYYLKALRLENITSETGELKRKQKQYTDAIREYRAALGMDSELPQTKEMVTPRIESSVLRKDRRQHERYLLKLPLNLREKGGSYYSANTVDVSKSGLLVESPRELAIGSSVEIETVLSEEGKKIALRGKVVRLDQVRAERGRRFGIQLFSASDDYPSWDRFIAA
jgi:tetratricopeptide (TPR) repeat protein